MHSQSLEENCGAKFVQSMEPTYPSARYFQIHFEFLQEQFQQTLEILESLQTQVHQLEQQISKVRQDIYAVPLQSVTGSQDALSRSPQQPAKTKRRAIKTL